MLFSGFIFFAVSLIGSLVLGALTGLIAGSIMGSEGSLLRNILLGIIGSMVGTAIFRAIGFRAYGPVANLIVGVVGACLVIFVARKIR